MSYSRPTIRCTDSEEVPEGDYVPDNISQNFPLPICHEPPPLSLEPENQRRVRSNSTGSIFNVLSEEGSVNPYFLNHKSSPTGDTFTRTQTILEMDWKKQRKSRTEEIADAVIGVIKESRSKLTKLITDVTVLFPFLKEKLILTPDDCDRIEHQRLRSLKTDSLIDIIITRGPEGVAYFYESLKLYYNHIYVTLKHIFEIKSIEIDSILDSSVRKTKGLSGYFCSIEEILGPEFAKERRDAQNFLDSISAVKMDNVTSQDVQELKEKYIELQKHYEPIQHMIDTLTNDITTKYYDIQVKNEGLTYENEAALAAIDKLCEDNREIYEKMNTLHLKIELQQEELERSKMENHEGENNSANFQKIMDLASSDEKLEMMRLHKQLEEEKIKNSEMNEQITAIRLQKDELFDLKENVLKENVELKKQLADFTEQDKRRNEDSRTKNNEKDLDKIQAMKHTLDRTTEEIGAAIIKMTGRNKSAMNEITIKSSVTMTDRVKQHLAQSLEIGVFFSDNLDQSLAKSFQPGDRILRINNIKLMNIANTDFPQFMMQQAENFLKLLIARGPTNMAKHPYAEHNFVLTDDQLDLSRCSSPNLEINRLTPMPSTISLNMDTPRRTSTQSHTTVSVQGGFTSTNQPSTHDNDTLTRAHVNSIELNTKELLSSHYENDSGNMSASCPQTPLFSGILDRQTHPFTQSNFTAITKKIYNSNKVTSIASDSGSDTYSQDSDPPAYSKPPSSLNLTQDSSPYRAAHLFEPVASPVTKEGNFDTISDIFGSSRTDTGLTGMVIVTRSKPTMRASPSAEDIALLLNKDQIRTTVPSDLFLKYAKISGGFGNPFFFSCSEELHQYRLKSGHKIYQINDLTTEYLTYEMFIDQCNLSVSDITLFISLKPSPHFKPDELSVRDHFYVIPQFTTKHITTKGELFISPSCVYLVTDTMVSKENASKQNRFWYVTRIDPRNCNNIEKGVIPSDMWLKQSVEYDDNGFEISISSQLSQGSRSLNSSVFEDDVNLKHVSHYYDFKAVEERKENYFTNSPLKYYTLVTRQDLLPQPVILFGYRWEEISEKLTKDATENSKFQLITPTILENVDYTKNAELEATQRSKEIIYYKGADGKSHLVNVKTLKECSENQYTPVLLCPIAQIANTPGLVALNPIVIRLKFKYKYNSSNKLDIPIDQRFHFDDMLRVGLSDEKYLKKLVSMIDKNRVLYEWKSIVIES